MTDEVQPLTWQKTTNAKEHQQFFAKINEIIDNLAPTVEEAEAATATANAAIADANTAIDNANTAIDNANAAIATADAASSEATTAAETVAGYAARLSAIEAAYIKKVADATQTIDSDLQIVNGHDLAVAGDLDVANNVNAAGAEIAGTAFEKNGAKTRLSNEDGLQIVGTTELDVADTTTGVRSPAAVNGRRLQNDLDAYAPMLRTTGNQTKVGVLTQQNTYGEAERKATGYRVGDTATGTNIYPVDKLLDADGQPIYILGYGRRADGSKIMRISLNNLMGDGTYKQSTIILNNHADGSAGLVLEDSLGRQITIGRTGT